MKFFAGFLVICMVFAVYPGSSFARPSQDDDSDNGGGSKGWDIQAEETKEDDATIQTITGISEDGKSSFTQVVEVTDEGTKMESSHSSKSDDGSSQSSSSASSSSSGSGKPGKTVTSCKTVDGVVITEVITISDDGTTYTKQVTKKALDGSSSSSESFSVTKEDYDEFVTCNENGGDENGGGSNNGGGGDDDDDKKSRKKRDDDDDDDDDRKSRKKRDGDDDDDDDKRSHKKKDDDDD